MILQQEKLFIQNNMNQKRSSYILLFKYEIVWIRPKRQPVLNHGPKCPTIGMGVVIVQFSGPTGL
jgi:hypothetical protein